MLDAKALAQLLGYKDCRAEQSMFLTAGKIPCCNLHWEKFADGIVVVSVEPGVPKLEECVDDEEGGLVWV